MKIVMLTPWSQRCGNAEYAKKLVDGFVDVEIFPIDLPNLGNAPKSARQRKETRTNFLRILSEIAQIEPDAVHIQHEFCFFGPGFRRSNQTFLWFMRQLSVRCVVTLHTVPGSLTVGHSRLKKRFFQALNPFQRKSRADFLAGLALCDRIIVHDPAAKQNLTRALGSFGDKVTLIKQPIYGLADEPNGLALGKKLKPEQEIWLLMVGFISRYKGHAKAIQVLAQLPDHYKLVVAGSGHPQDSGFSEYWSELLALADRLGVSHRVKYTGYLSVSDQRGYFSAADAFLLPYDEVGQSGSAVLADLMSYDTAIFTSDAKSMFAYRGEPSTANASISVFPAWKSTLSERQAKSVSAQILHFLATDNPKMSPWYEARLAAREKFSEQAVYRAHRDIYAMCAGLPTNDQI